MEQNESIPPLLLDFAIVGAGFTGLGTAAGFRSTIAGKLPPDELEKGFSVGKEGRLPSFRIFESGPSVGGFWKDQYTALKFHTEGHHLPFSGKIRAEFPPYLSPVDIVQYFGKYADHFRVSEHLTCDSKLHSLEELPKGFPYRWKLCITEKGEEKIYYCKYVAICTGFNNTPKVPPIPKMELYKGSKVHSRWYKDGKKYKNQRVLVIGSGNSAVDQATDISKHAASVDISMRTPRHFIATENFLTKLSKQFGERGFRRYFISAYRASPNRIRGLQFHSNDLSAYNIGPPSKTLEENPYYIPNYDQGFVKALEEKRVVVIPSGVKEFTKEGVCFDNDVKKDYDAVILATGYRTGLENFICDKETFLEKKEAPFDEYGWLPKTYKNGRSTVDRSLYFIGYQPHAVGLFNGYSGWIAGERIGCDFKHSVEHKSFIFRDNSSAVKIAFFGTLISVPLATGAIFLLLRRAKVKNTKIKR